MDYLKDKFTRKIKTARVNSARTARATSIYSNKRSRKNQRISEDEVETSNVKELGRISLPADIDFKSIPIELPFDESLTKRSGLMRQSSKTASVFQNPLATDIRESATRESRKCDDFIPVNALLSDTCISGGKGSIENGRRDVTTAIIQPDSSCIELSTPKRLSKSFKRDGKISATPEVRKRVRTELQLDDLPIEDDMNLSLRFNSLRKPTQKDKLKLSTRSNSFKNTTQNFIQKLTGRARSNKKRKGLDSINFIQSASVGNKDDEMEEMTEIDETTPRFINRSTLPIKIVRSPNAMNDVEYRNDKILSHSNTLPTKLRRQYSVKLHQQGQTQSQLYTPPTPFKVYRYNVDKQEVSDSESLQSEDQTKRISVELKLEIKESLLNWRSGKLNSSDSTVTLPSNFKPSINFTANSTPTKLLDPNKEQNQLRPLSWACDGIGGTDCSSKIQANSVSDIDTLACCDRLSFTSGSSQSSLPNENTTSDHEQFVDGRRLNDILKTHSLNRFCRSERRMSQPHFLKARNIRLGKKLDTIEASPVERRVRTRKIRQRSHSAPSASRLVSTTVGSSNTTDQNINSVTKLPADILTTGNRSSIQAFTSAICYRAVADPLFHHVTHEEDELAFHVGDVILVLDQSDKHWWWGRLLNTSTTISTGTVRDREGFFPSPFVRLRANQDSDLEQESNHVENTSGEHDDEIKSEPRDDPDEKRWKAGRTNVVKEILSAERDYVKILSDIVQGYLAQSRSNQDMFTSEQITLIFGNIEDIHKVSQHFLEQLESCAKTADQSIHKTLVGAVFLKHKDSFEVYSSYCNNHPQSLSQLSILNKQEKYGKYWEGCRLLQNMIELPLDGFLLTPIQKICKYPLQLQELLKYTPPTHPDHQSLQSAYTAMKNMATLINERKRKLESIQKIYSWQQAVEEWQGDEIVKSSSELIHSGELSKLSSGGRLVERYFFLFDHQLVQCKREKILSKILTYKNRFNLDELGVVTNEKVSGTAIKHGFQLTDSEGNTVIALSAKTSDDREKWLKSFKRERAIVESDQKSGFVLDSKFLSHARLIPTKTKPNKNGITRSASNGSSTGRHQSGSNVPTSRQTTHSEEVDSNSNIRTNGNKPSKPKDGVKLRKKTVS